MQLAFSTWATALDDWWVPLAWSSIGNKNSHTFNGMRQIIANLGLKYITSCTLGTGNCKYWMFMPCFVNRNVTVFSRYYVIRILPKLIVVVQDTAPFVLKKLKLKINTRYISRKLWVLCFSRVIYSWVSPHRCYLLSLQVPITVYT